MDVRIAQSFAKTLNEIRQFVEGQIQLPDPNSGFSLFVQSEMRSSDNEASLSLPWPSESTLKHPQSLACFGFMTGIDSTYHPELQPDWRKTSAEMFLRDPFPLDRQSFVHRPIEVLGLALGVLNCQPSDDSLLRSFRSVLDGCKSKGNSDLWSQLIYWFAAKLVGSNAGAIPAFDVRECSLESVAFIKWLNLKPEFANDFHEALVAKTDARILGDCGLGKFALENSAQATVLLAALEATVQMRIESRLQETLRTPSDREDAIQLVVKLCRNFPLFARQLQQRRKDIKGKKPKERLPRPTITMKDEYDVQDSLYAILRLFFDDVRAEPWTPEYGANQNRIDFVLPQFKIAIEVKHTRDKLTQRDVTDQLIIDERYYRRHESCSSLICFVYDPELRLKNPVALENDLAKDEDDFNVVVIVSPHGL